MNDWQRSFLPKLEAAKKQWLHKFEDFATTLLEPVFSDFDNFATTHGFAVSAPACDSGMRLFKFGLTENGYVLFTFRMHGLEGVEVYSEVYVPSHDKEEPTCAQAILYNADRDWVSRQFQEGLDRFIVVFTTAGAAAAGRVDQMVTE